MLYVCVLCMVVYQCVNETTAFKLLATACVLINDHLVFIINNYLPQGKEQYKRLEPVQGTARSTTTNKKTIVYICSDMHFS